MFPAAAAVAAEKRDVKKRDIEKEDIEEGDEEGDSNPMMMASGSNLKMAAASRVAVVLYSLASTAASSSAEK